MINQAQCKIYLQYLTDDRSHPACVSSGTQIDTSRHMVHGGLTPDTSNTAQQDPGIQRY